MSVPKPRILVTGGAGFTGNHLIQRLLADGQEVRTLVRDPQKLSADQAANLDVVVGDVRDREACFRAAEGCEVVYHIAASFRSGKATTDELMDVNANGTRNMLDASEHAGVSRFVHCSTIGVLGHVETPPANEETPYNPCDDYQYSKMMGEQIVLEYARAGRVPATVVRPASIYGEGDLRLLKLFRSIKKGMFFIVGSGEPHFHMVHVDDLATGFMLAAASERSVGEIYIIAGEHSITINELSCLIAQELQAPAPRWKVPYGAMYAVSAMVEDVCKPLGIEPPLYRRRVDFFHHNRSFEISKARQHLGYTPRIAVHEGIRRTAQWYAEQKLL